MSVLKSPLVKVFFGIAVGVAVIGHVVGPDDTVAATQTAAVSVGWGGGVTVGTAPAIIDGFKSGLDASQAANPSAALGAQKTPDKE